MYVFNNLKKKTFFCRRISYDTVIFELCIPRIKDADKFICMPLMVLFGDCFNCGKSSAQRFPGLHHQHLTFLTLMSNCLILKYLKFINLAHRIKDTETVDDQNWNSYRS